MRAILGLYNAFSILAYRRAVARTFGSNVANWFTRFQACQFHLMFYASRTLPNMIPFGLGEHDPKEPTYQGYQWLTMVSYDRASAPAPNGFRQR